MAYCIQCGKQNPNTSRFCTGCGAALSPATTRPATDTKKKGPWVEIGIVVLLGLAAGAYFLFFNKKEKQEVISVGNDYSKRLKDLVQRWNESLNRASIPDVSAMYAQHLVYYRSQMSASAAAEQLSNFFQQNPHFSQQITSEISIEKINDNLFVCSFQKTVTMDGKSTDYPSYLKFSKVEGNWLIVEEGDKITDYNINKTK